MAFIPDLFVCGGFPQKPPRQPFGVPLLFAGSPERLASGAAHGLLLDLPRLGTLPLKRATLFAALRRAAAPLAGRGAGADFPQKPPRSPPGVPLLIRWLA